MLEDLHIGVPVSGANGAHLGTLSRVIVDAKSEQVVGIVVDPGLVASGNLLAPGGWERPRERVVPIALLASADKHGIHMTCDEATFGQLALFEREQATTVASEGVGGRFELGQLVSYAASEFGLGGAPYAPPMEITHAEPVTAGAIAEHTPVWRLVPHEHIGDVERVLVDAQTQRVSGLVLHRGFLRHRVLLPVSAIASIEDGVVHARLSDAELENLPLYEPGG
ncbi:MAG TPA: PRC-barrel domain-containing protein [Ktedonobacterales bacterium]